MTRRSPRSLHVGAWLALLALAARLLVPAGFMPGTGAGGAAALVICSGQGPMVMAAMSGMAMPMAHGEGGKDQGHGQSGDHACPFASFAAVADLAALIPPPLPFVATTVVPSAVRLVARPGLGLAAPPPPKTGPPSSR